MKTAGYAWLPMALLVCRFASAQGPVEAPSFEEIAVVPSSCSELPWTGTAWIALVRVELAADGTRVSVAAAKPPGPTPTLRVEPSSCDPSSSSATLTLEVARRSVVRTVDLVRVAPPARARVLALAAAELVHSSRHPAPEGAPAPPTIAAPIATPPPPTPQEVPAPKESPTGTASSRRRSVDLFVVGDVHVFGAGGATLIGSRVGAQLRLPPWYLLSLDAGVSFGRSESALGSVDSALTSLGVSALGVGRVSDLSVGVGPRVEVGVASFQGHAASQSTIAAAASGPEVLVSISAIAALRVAGPWAVFLGIDAGASAVGYAGLANGQKAAAIEGPMLAARLGFSWEAL